MEESNEAGYFFVGLLIGVLVVSLVFGLASIGDGSDTINTKILGTKLCESQNLTYDYREFQNIKSTAFSDKIPIIHCKNTIEENGLIDGVVLKG